MDSRFNMLSLALVCLCSMNGAVSDQFKATVIEHAETSAHINTTGKALQIMMINLDALEVSVKEASRQGAAIVVFPEYGITGGMPNIHAGRPTVYPYAMQVPAVGTVIPARNQSINSVLVRIAMMAQKYELYIVANLIERVSCTTEDNMCPGDEHFQYNTNLVFAKNRTLLAKYHKFHMWEEENVRLDKPEHPEYAWFDTEFGRFGTFICYDVNFYEPAIKLVEEHEVDHIAFTTYWGVKHDCLFSNVIQFTFGFARRLNVNFLASNIHNETAYAWGSHISTPNVVLNSTYGPAKNFSDVVITSTLNSKQLAADSKPGACSTEDFPLGESKLMNLQRLVMNVTRLEGLTDKTRVCFKKLCCNVNFERNNTKELFILSAFEGLIPDFDPDYRGELCMVSKCQNDSISSCDTRDDTSHTLFTTFEMHAQFQSDYVSPSWTGARHTYTGIEWDYTYDGKCNMISASQRVIPMLSATLFGFH